MPKRGGNEQLQKADHLHCAMIPKRYPRMVCDAVKKQSGIRQSIRYARKNTIVLGTIKIRKWNERGGEREKKKKSKKSK